MASKSAAAPIKPAQPPAPKPARGRGRGRTRKTDPPDPNTVLAFSLAEFQRAYRVSRSTTFELIATGKLKTYRLGRRRFVSPHAAKEWQLDLERAEAA